MRYEYSPYILPLLAAAIISGWVAFYSWRRRANLGAFLLALLAVMVVQWSIGYALEIAGADLRTKIFWGKFQYFGIVLVPVIWAGFAFHHANRAKWLTFRTAALLMVIPSITFLLALTTETHGLLWKTIGITSSGTFSALDISYGFWFWIHTAYSYVLLMIGTILVIRSIGRMAGVYRGQAAILLLAVLAPWIGNALYLSGYSPVPKMDLTPFAFTITVVAFTLGIHGYQLIDLAPIARATIIDEMDSGMIVLDMENQIVDINPSALKIIEQVDSQVLGKKAAEVLARWPELTERYRDVMDATDEISVGEGTDQRWFELQFSAIHNRRLEVIGRAITITNITSHKHAERLVMESQARYRQIVESASDVIYRTDAEGHFTYANPIALRLMGFQSESEIVGRHYLELAAPHMRRELKRFYDRQFLSRQKNTYYEFATITTEGKEIWLGQNVQIIEEDGQIVGFQAVAREITELKRMQEVLALARDHALEASQLKSQLLTKVSHELRTPLGGILGYAELLQINAFGTLNDKQMNAALQIIESTNYLTKLVNELLDEAQIEGKTIKIFPQQFSPVDFLHSTEARVIALAKKKKLSLVTVIDPDLPTTIFGDEQRLQQILMNLVGNAIKFTSEGQVTVELLRLNHDEWAMQVSDTGPGIPKEAREYIFEPFRQIDTSNTSDNSGTGLGLAIAKQLAEIMGGQVVLESEMGKGSTFTIRLPLQITGGDST